MDKFRTHSILENEKLLSTFTSPVNKFEVTRIGDTKTSSTFLLNTKGFDKKSLLNLFSKLSLKKVNYFLDSYFGRPVNKVFIEIIDNRGLIWFHYLQILCTNFFNIMRINGFETKRLI